MKILCKLFGHKTKKETDIIIRISGFAEVVNPSVFRFCKRCSQPVIKKDIIVLDERDNSQSK